MTEESPWKRLKLSLERPYKDDDGEYIPVLFDITPDGQHIYEPREDPSKTLGENLRRIFLERGADFFEKHGEHMAEQAVEPEADLSDERLHNQPMTADELLKMRTEMLPQLYIALGEMSHARDLLALLLSSPSPQKPSPIAPPPSLSATIVTKPLPIPSVQAFNTELSVGGKDEALRKAASVFKLAGESMERGRLRGEKYWVHALKIRRANWGLIPAPLPFGSATGKGADKSSKDFLISFGLEESTPAFRRRAISHMPTYETSSGALEFPHRQRTRLRVRLTTVGEDGKSHVSQNVLRVDDEDDVDPALKAAQQEIVEQEIFSLLIKESGNLTTASATVAERLIVVEAAHNTELCFELVDNESIGSFQDLGDRNGAKCDLIFATLHMFLLRAHAHTKRHRLRGQATNSVNHTPPLLQPIIDVLQYEVFCHRIEAEIGKVTQALSQAGVPSTVRLNTVGDSGEQLVELLIDDNGRKIAGEAVLRIDNRDTLRFTFMSPSSLYAHLPQATISVSSIPQLSQLLADEVEQCLLSRICQVGTELCGGVNGTWFVDLVTGRSVGRWEGCVLFFRIFYGDNFAISCSAFRLDRVDGHPDSLLDTYKSAGKDGIALLSWVEQTIKMALSR